MISRFSNAPWGFAYLRRRIRIVFFQPRRDAIGMIQMGLFESLVVVVLSVALSAGYLALTKHSPLDPLPHQYPPRPKAEGVMAHNTLLHRVEKIGVGQLPGPEDLAVDSQGRIYTGCSDGWVKRIETDGRVLNWTYIGGRPVGLVVGLNGEILLCAASQGLLNVTEGHMEVLSNEADGVKHNLANGVDVAKDGTIYFTDSSKKFDESNIYLDIIEGRANGQLLKYDPSTRKTTILVNDLYFPNGVALSKKEDFLVFCETSKARCLRYWLAGEKEGTTDDFLHSTLGYPDNVRSNKKGKFYVALVSNRSWLNEEVILRLSFLKHILAHPKVLPLVLSNIPKASRVLVVDEEGTPLGIYEDPNGKELWSISSGLEVGEHLYLGTFETNYIARLKL